MKRFSGFAVLLLLLGLIISLGRVPQAEAGIYNAGDEVTYKEYWIHHNQFTGGCTSAGLPVNPNGSFFSEPEGLNKCPKEMLLTIQDDISGALRAEVYVDMWRTDDRTSPRLRINGQPTVYQPPRGYDWSRTPWVIDVPLASLAGQSANTFLFWAEYNKYHIYDVAVRIYFDDTHPLLVGGVPASAVDGELLTIADDSNVDISADTGGRLLVNNDKLTLKANVGSGAKVVEFHAYYEGYDDDSDGVRHDWHNVNRNNWNPGGTAENQTEVGSTLNNIGNVKAPVGGGTVPITWNLPYIVNQSGVRFKIRIVAANGIVREAAGGETPEYSLVRYYPVVYYTMPNFDDFGLHMDGSRPDVVNYTFPLPANLDLSLYEKAYLLGMYWKKPQYSINGSKAQGANPGEQWSLGVRELPNISSLLPGDNALSYVYGGGGGSAVEHPGPMIVLKGKYAGVPELAPPFIISRSPASNSTNVDIFSSVVARLGDFGSGIDKNSIIMSVNNVPVTPVLSGPSNDLALTYTPNTPFPTESSVKVTVYACDLLGNCMSSADEYYFETEPPDTTAPIISNVFVNTTNTSATVTWTTDEGATSKVDWGASIGYEKPSVSDPALVTQHSLPLAGLQPNTTYNFRLTSTNYGNLTTVTSNLTFKTKRDPGAILSDEFAGCTLDTSVWSYINPLNDAPLKMTGAGAQISVPAGISHDLWKQGLKAPRLMQYVNNQNFDVEVKFDSTIGKNTQTMGILVQQDTNNWIRFNFQSNGPSTHSIVVVDSINNNPVAISTMPITIGATNYMRLNRAGDLWNLQYSGDGSNWIFATTVTRTLTMSEIGPYVGNTGPNPAHVGVIDYFENLASPLSGDDTLPQLNVVKVGGGTVTRVPDKPNYECNETVQLTAVPDAEWEFGGWSGAINSANPTTSIVITQTANVVATFTNSTLYVVNVGVVSQGGDVGDVGGTVAKTPNQTTYLYGDEVTLTATSTPGWSFVGWSGDFIGTDPVAVVPVSGDMNITATFDKDEYTLDTMLLADGVGVGGAITVDPVQPTYKYGDAVTLTLTINPGWTFVGWEGEGVSGVDTTLNLTMTRNVVAIAHIAQNQYALDVTIINNGDDEGLGNGVVRTPEQTTYGYGQMVTLAASPDLGWEFGGWGGALSGMELTRTLEITQDNAITATFNQIQYELDVTSTGNGSVTVTPQKDYYVFGDVVTLTPVPEKGYEFVLWTGDVTGAVKPLHLTITQDYTLEAVFGVDATPIEILSHSIEVHGGTVAVVSWTTDVPGNSRVDYGETVSYEAGGEEKGELVTTHKITLTNLKPETYYHYRIQSVDEEGNDVYLEDLTFSTSSSSGLASDDFSSCVLSNRWTWVDPLDDSNYSIGGGGVSISVPADSQHNIWSTGIDVPRLMQSSNNTDFTIEVKFDSSLIEGGAMQGIIIEQDEGNFVRFNFYKRTEPTPELVLHAYTFVNSVYKQIGTNPRLPDTPAPMYFRIVREGDKWTQLYSFDGTTWIENVAFTHPITVKQVGVFSGNTSFKGKIPAHTAVIDYFFNSASPIVPEDSFYKITTDGIEGSGKITLQPSKSGYYCGEEVKATATGAPGWSFLEWGGDLTGSLPTRTFTVTDHMNITARFQQGAATYRQFMPFAIGRKP